jgi:D-amino-acid dehydrogenase
MAQTVIVIGAGFTGICVAEHLRRAGASVTLLDRAKPGDPAQASFGNAGILARTAIVPALEPDTLPHLPKYLFGPDSPLTLRWSYLPKFLPFGLSFLRNAVPARVRRITKSIDLLAHDTVQQHLALAKGTSAEKFISSSNLTYLYRQRRDFAANRFSNALLAEMGIVPDLLDLPELRETDPQLGDAYRFGARYSGNGYVSDPSAYLQALKSHFEANGGTFVQVAVKAVDGQTVVVEGGPDLRADTIVIATGAWSKSLTRSLGHKVPLEGERGYHLMLRNPSFAPPSPYLVADAKYGLTPMDGGIRCAGTTEFAPLDSDASTRPFRVIRQSLRRLYPTLTWDGEDEWMGHRPSTPDSLPMLGRTKANPNVVFAFGSQHLGLTIGPKLGVLASQIVLNRTPNMDISALAVDRFD